MLSIRVKELFEPIVCEKKKLTGFCSFLKAFSWETDLWVTLGDFTRKKCKIGEGNLYLTENRLGRNEIWCAEDNHTYMCHIYAKGLCELWLSSYWQNINFSRNCPKFHIFTKIVSF